MTLSLAKLSSMVIRDVLGKLWQLDRLIGQGGFAGVYSAISKNHNEMTAVVKVFKTKQSYTTELFSYQNICAPHQVNLYKAENGLGHLGCPKIYGHGTHVFIDSRGKTHRFNFIVMQKLYPIKQLLCKDFRENNLVMMCVQILDVLNFMHSKGWTHNDIKYDNIMVDSNRNFYLIDYGLATTFFDALEEPSDIHTGGTISYMSIDVHRGYINPPRGDLVNLMFMLKVLLTEPWDINKNVFSIATNILIEKESFIENPDCKEFTPFAVEILKYTYSDKPNYQLLKRLLPIQPSVSSFKKFYEQHCCIKQPFWAFSIIFQTQILPYIYRLAVKLATIKTLKNEALITATDLHNLLKVKYTDSVLESCSRYVISEKSHYDPSAITHVEECISSWIIHLAKLYLKIRRQYNQSLNCTLQHITRMLTLTRP